MRESNARSDRDFNNFFNPYSMYGIVGDDDLKNPHRFGAGYMPGEYDGSGRLDQEFDVYERWEDTYTNGRLTDSKLIGYRFEEKYSKKDEIDPNSDPYVQKTQKFHLDAGIGITGGDVEGRVATISVASYSMDITVSVFKAGVFDSQGNLSFIWRAKISAVSFVSAVSGDLITKGSFALIDNGTTLGEYSLMPPNGTIIPTLSGQYSYVGERYVDLPNSYGNVQIQFLGTWMIDNMGLRQIPVSVTQPEGLSVSQNVTLH
jgi:hypothetical protein